jgi:excisionase family DNA binding protein
MAKRRKRKAGKAYDPNALLRRTELLQKDRLRVDEAAQLLDRSPAQVYRYIEAGKFEVKRTPGGQIRIPLDGLRKWI